MQRTVASAAAAAAGKVTVLGAAVVAPVLTAGQCKGYIPNGAGATGSHQAAGRDKRSSKFNLQVGTMVVVVS